jgi:uroporphyrinogen-III synthase
MSKLLNLGITPLESFENYEIVHDPIIEIVPGLLTYQDLEWICASTYCILTSKIAAKLFLSSYGHQLKNLKKMISIGEATTKVIESLGFHVDIQAQSACQEGIVELLMGLDLVKEKIILPRSDLSRREIDGYLLKAGIDFYHINLYQTVMNPKFSVPDLSQFEGVYFSSSSCVKYFFECYGLMPDHLKTYCIGKVTSQSLLKSLDN